MPCEGVWTFIDDYLLSIGLESNGGREKPIGISGPGCHAVAGHHKDKRSDLGGSARWRPPVVTAGI
jgi:hypothetical protein